jgi:hypothetical protein
MSADRWAKCPKCLKELNANLKSAYGKVSEDEYLYALVQVNEQDETLREDYEVKTDEDGRFTVNYSCQCTICKFKFEYRYKQAVLV